MKIAVISDTHLEAPTPWFKKVFDTYLFDTDMIVHCGDHTGTSLRDYIERSHPDYRGVQGNMDAWTLTDLPAMDRMVANGFTIGMTHGWGPRPGVPAKVAEAFGDGFDVILYGHTHAFLWQKTQYGSWLLNPGSLQQAEPSFAYLYLEQGQEPRAEQVVPE